MWSNDDHRYTVEETVPLNGPRKSFASQTGDSGPDILGAMQIDK
ncbi:hypothetical protein C900_03896 [Fulvivirga imtechensis AK7]|uniref:Uncharacterized protein n=1 Tax=Fulvivirga imtechensis AK7 TaxID=1237149 RepID=L8JMQ9_9BACT|nr:hypothetical protein C900_03896 [Fulvivirga imtechensis AK7]